MPLLDHFHPPLSLTHSWESFHARWAVALAPDAIVEQDGEARQDGRRSGADG